MHLGDAISYPLQIPSGLLPQQYARPLPNSGGIDCESHLAPRSRPIGSLGCLAKQIGVNLLHDPAFVWRRWYIEAVKCGDRNVQAFWDICIRSGQTMTVRARHQIGSLETTHDFASEFIIRLPKRRRLTITCFDVQWRRPHGDQDAGKAIPGFFYGAVSAFGLIQGACLMIGGSLGKIWIDPEPSGLPGRRFIGRDCFHVGSAPNADFDACHLPLD